MGAPAAPAGEEFAHTPWDGSHPAFRIGLKPLGDTSWIEVDEKLKAQLDEKRQLLATRHEDVFRALPESMPAQEEALELVLAELAQHHAGTHQRKDNLVSIGDTGVDLDDPGMAPLEKASLLIQEDLVIMMPGNSDGGGDAGSNEGWRLAAGCVCFPSSWLLAEKFGKPLQQVHAKVPEFGPGTRNAVMINRIFDNLKIDIPAIRENWSIYSDDELFHGFIKAEQPDAARSPRFLRVEIQTLHKMKRTGAILFTIRIHVDPIARLENHPDRQRLARGLAESLARLDQVQCNYKGMTETRDALVARIEAIADS